jgi:hypothetical protein
MGLSGLPRQEIDCAHPAIARQVGLGLAVIASQCIFGPDGSHLPTLRRDLRRCLEKRGVARSGRGGLSTLREGIGTDDRFPQSVLPAYKTSGRKNRRGLIPKSPRDFSQAAKLAIDGVTGLVGDRERHVRRLAVAGAFAEVTSALAVRADLPNSYVEKLMTGRRSDGLLALVRAIGLSWPTVKAILTLRADKRIILETEIGYCLACYERLMPETAQQIIHFYRDREKGGATAPAQKTK